MTFTRTLGTGDILSIAARGKLAHTSSVFGAEFSEEAAARGVGGRAPIRGAPEVGVVEVGEDPLKETRPHIDAPITRSHHAHYLGLVYFWFAENQVVSYRYTVHNFPQTSALQYK